jgi:RNA polymerase sigma factor (TIGR02999 family)
VSTSSEQEISLLLRAWRGGDQAALDQLIPLVYDELHRLAHRFMVRERVERTLQTTALVNEAYLRLVDANEVEWKDRVHFFAISANLMRRILVDFARSRNYRKRGGNVKKVSLNAERLIFRERDPDIVKLDEALNDLASFDSRKAKVVELRFFAGLTVDETAEVLGVSPDTVMRDWKVAKVWLRCELRDRANK